MLGYLQRLQLPNPCRSLEVISQLTMFCEMLVLWSMLSSLLPAAGAAKLNVSIVAAGTISRTILPSFVYLGAPLTVAIEHVNRKYGETMHFTLATLYNPERLDWGEYTDDLDGMVSEWHYKYRDERDLTVYLSPSFPPMTTLPYCLQEWNNLFITTMLASTAIRNRTLNPTWISTNFFAFSTCVDLYNAVFTKYNWTSTYIVADNSSDPFFKDLGNMVKEGLKEAGVKSVWKEIMTKNAHPYGQFAPLLEQARTMCRVILFFGHGSYLRELLLLAETMNMTNGEYVYIVPQSMRNNPKAFGLLDWQYDDSDDPVAFQAYQSVMIVHPRDIDKPFNEYLAPKFLEKSLELYNFSYPLPEQPFFVLTDTYNAVATLGEVLNETLTSGKKFNYQNGTALAELFFNRTFPDDGGAGEIYIDSYGMRRTDFTVSYFTPNGTRQPLLHIIGMTGALEEAVDLKNWVNDSFPPPNEPVCGFLHQRPACQSKRDHTITYIIIGSLAGSVVIFGGVALGWLRSIRRKAEERLLLSPWWHVILTSVSGVVSRSAFFSGMSRTRLDAISVTSKHADITHTTNVYQGKPVMVRNICYRNYPTTFKNLSSDNGFLQIMIKFYKIDHPNICRFFGITITVSETCTVSAVFERPPRGSFLDICNSFITKDFGFASSLIVDYLDAVEFIHACTFHYHGQISILACWVDRHFTLKLTNLALDRLTRELCRTSEHFKECSQPTVTESFYWMTPETLDPSNVNGMQAVDIFASGFIIYEILTKASLHAKIQLKEPEELDSYVMRRNPNPLLEGVDFANFRKFEPLLRSCWSVDPTQRPSIRKIRSRIGDISPLLVVGSRRSNVVEELFNRLAGYSADLENEVAIRTVSLKEEMEKCDSITAHYLPRAIVKRMRAGQHVEAEIFESVSIMFTDMFGFADFVKFHTAEETITLIGLTEAWFDTLSTKCEVYKVEAVGDSFLVASGLPIRIGHEHILRTANFALKLMDAESSLTFLKDLKLKIGIHSGSCAAGVLGLRRPRYCLFGDTINTASRMCSLGLPSRIHISADFQSLLARMPEFTVELRGTITVKGKATMTTYWLTGKSL